MRSRDAEHFLEECENLEKDYADREMELGMREKAKELACIAFEHLADRPVDTLEAGEFRALFVICEVLDYFNVLDSQLGTERGRYGPDQIYGWLLNLSNDVSKELSKIQRKSSPLNLREVGEREAVRIIEKSRFVSAVGLNEEYRRHQVDPGRDQKRRDQDDKLKKMIRYLEEEPSPEQLKRLPDPAAYEARRHDNLAFMYFLLAKRRRQRVRYEDSENAMYQASNHLVRLALCESIAGEKQTEVDEATSACRNVHRALLRLGVVDLARAWLYLAWGRIEKTEATVARALHLIGPKDELNRLQARSIDGTIKRIRAGTSTKDLLEARQSLQTVFESFTKGGVSVPRYAVRTLYELVLALIVGGELDTAVAHLEAVIAPRELTRKTGGPDLLKMLDNLGWAIQIRTLLSLIARKNAKHEAPSKIPTGSRTKRDRARETDRERRDRAREIRGRLVRLIKSLAWPKGFDEEEFPVKPDRDRSLAIAEYCASVAEGLAGDSANLRVHKIDALIALGEAYIDDGNYDKAAKQFHSCLRILESVRTGIPDPPGNEYLSICQLYLIQIAVSQGLGEPAQQLMAEYRKLPKIEHRWILDQEKAIEAEVEYLVNNRIIIPFSRKSDWWLLQDWLWREVYEKVRDGRTDAELAGDLHVSESKVSRGFRSAFKRFDMDVRPGPRPNTKRRTTDKLKKRRTSS